jgi:hypothetical protein
MKNKDCIKNSIKKNIVNHDEVLNNIRARAAVNEARTASKGSCLLGLRRAVVALSMLVLIAAGAVGSTHFFQRDGGYPPRDNSVDCESQYGVQSNCISDETGSNKSQNEGIQDETSAQSREPHGGDESGDTITREPLDAQTAVFFADFADKLVIYEKLIYTLFEYDADYINDEDTLPYRPVTDCCFSSLEDIHDFLYAFLTPELAQENYIKLVLADNPKYIERDGRLFMDTSTYGNGLHQIDTSHAFFVFRGSDEMRISALSNRIYNSMNYYRSFYFVKIEGKWLLKSQPW